jgi:hypothetical protein
MRIITDLLHALRCWSFGFSEFLGTIVGQEAENGVSSHEIVFLEGQKAMHGHWSATEAVSQQGVASQ